MTNYFKFTIATGLLYLHYYNIFLLYFVYNLYSACNVSLVIKKYIFKQNLIKFYKEHNASKLQSVDVIVEKYIENPKYIMNILRERYKINKI